jgi:hypothetical protein
LSEVISVSENDRVCCARGFACPLFFFGSLRGGRFFGLFFGFGLFFFGFLCVFGYCVAAVPLLIRLYRDAGGF